MCFAGIGWFCRKLELLNVNCIFASSAKLLIVINNPMMASFTPVSYAFAH